MCLNGVNCIQMGLILPIVYTYVYGFDITYLYIMYYSILSIGVLLNFLRVIAYMNFYDLNQSSSIGPFKVYSILVPRASRPHASSLGPGTHRTGTARKLALISNAHGN